jgi:hypothetical protein
MPSIERTTIDQGPCPCGKGHLVVYECTREPVYPGGMPWNEYELSCAECSETYIFLEGKLVFKADVDESKQRRDRCHKKEGSIMASASVKQLLDRFVERLDQEKSMAAKCRALNGHSAARGGERTFRRNFKNSRSVADNTRASDLRWVLDFLGLQDPQLTRDLEELDVLREEANKPIPSPFQAFSSLM